MIIIFDLTEEPLEPDLCLRDGPLHKYVKLRDAYLINQVLVLFYPPLRKAKSLIEIELQLNLSIADTVGSRKRCPL